MAMDDLVEFIYHPHPNAPHCPVCIRPIVLKEHEGKMYLFCKHCMYLAEEDRILEETAESTKLFPDHGFR